MKIATIIFNFLATSEFVNGKRSASMCRQLSTDWKKCSNFAHKKLGMNIDVLVDKVKDRFDSMEIGVHEIQWGEKEVSEFMAEIFDKTITRNRIIAYLVFVKMVSQCEENRNETVAIILSDYFKLHAGAYVHNIGGLRNSLILKMNN